MISAAHARAIKEQTNVAERGGAGPGPKLDLEVDLSSHMVQIGGFVLGAAKKGDTSVEVAIDQHGEELKLKLEQLGFGVGLQEDKFYAETFLRIEW
jgi:hypothetical protein